MAIFHAEFFSKCLMRLVDVDICLPIEDLVEQIGRASCRERV